MSANPYATPSTQPESEVPTFRCTFLRRLLTRVVGGKVRDPRHDGETGEYELFQIGFVRVVTVACLFSPVPAITLYLNGNVDLRAFLVAVFIGEVLAAIMWSASESVCFTDTYIRRHGPFFRKTKIRWHDLESMQVTRGGDLVFVDRNRRKLVVHNDLRGQHALFATIRRVVPQELLAPQEQNLIELQKLVC